MKDNRKLLYGLVALALILSVTGISVGFATLRTQLNIEGTTAVNPSNWKIKFQNLSEPTLEGTAQVNTAPTITNDTHLGDYSVTLKKPGDSVTYTFEVANTGDIDAELTTYTKANPTITATGSENGADDVDIVTENLVYTLTYSNGDAIATGNELAHGRVKTLKLTVAYNQSATALPQDEVTISDMDVTFIYSQK